MGAVYEDGEWKGSMWSGEEPDAYEKRIKEEEATSEAGLAARGVESLNQAEDELASGDFVPSEAETADWATKAADQARKQVQGVTTQVAQAGLATGPQMEGAQHEALMDIGEQAGEGAAQAGMEARKLQQQVGETRSQALRDEINRRYEFARQMYMQAGRDTVNAVTSGISSIGQILGGLGLFLMACWVAEELFGPEHEKTHLARYYCQRNHDNWFVKIYMEHGFQWASWLRRHPWAKPLVRPIWEYMAFRGRKLLELKLIGVEYGRR